MAKSRYDAQYVLGQMQVTGQPRVFVLGCRAQRVTVLSQQYRAFNLVWALFATDRLKPGSRLGVVGGGIGGLTVAAAALSKGCKVVLAEEKSELMHLQRGNTTRLLHPNIYEWPRSGADRRSTRFPCMNWTAGSAGAVVSALDLQWDAIKERYRELLTVKTRVRVNQLEICSGVDAYLRMTAEEWECTHCDIVVLAVGFGTEVERFPDSTYWQDESLGQSVRGNDSVRRYFVSGVGDGGCIDILRLSYERFRHDSFVERVIRLPHLQQLARQLLKIDLHIPASNPSQYLHDEYEKLSLPIDFAQQLGSLRNDTYIEVNSPEPFPLSPKACILHRVAVWGLYKTQRFTFRPGALDVQAIEQRQRPDGVRFAVPVPGEDGQGIFHRVVLRHGPRGRLSQFPDVEANYAGISGPAIRDRTRKQLFPEGFYPPSADAGHGPETTSTEFLEVINSAGVAFTPPVSPPREAALPVAISAATSGASLAAVPALIMPDEILRLERFVSMLDAQTRAQNYPEAMETQAVVESLLGRSSTKFPAELWQRAHLVLWKFEKLARAASGGESRTTARLEAILERMANGNR